MLSLGPSPDAGGPRRPRPSRLCRCGRHCKNNSRSSPTCAGSSTPARTTAEPKGVMGTRASDGLHGPHGVRRVRAFPRNIRYLAASPITHTAGMHVVPTLLAAASAVYFREDFESQTLPAPARRSDPISLWFRSADPSCTHCSTIPISRATNLTGLESNLDAALADVAAPARRRSSSTSEKVSSRSTTPQSECPGPRQMLRAARSRPSRFPGGCRRAGSRSRRSASHCSATTTRRCGR